MRIQNNIMALNTHRFYTNNNNAVSKSAEKLSSGYKINRAGDDAAGLAISEKMRREIRGLSMASKNAQDGVSMVQTAEGALQEVHSMLQRMSEIAVQAASDSNDDAVDRPSLDAEFQQLIKEIDQIAETTTFNDMNLLDGSFTDKQIQVGSNNGVTLGISIDSMSADGLALATKTPKLSAAPAAAGTEGKAAAKAKVEIDFADIKMDAAGTLTLKIGDQTVESAAVAEGDIGDSEKLAAAFDTKTFDFDGKKFTATVAGSKVTFEADANGETTKVAAAAAAATVEGTVPPALVKVTDRASASAAIDSVKAAIRTVSDQRAALGAVQNRLEHKISNLDNTVENVSAAESRIRDVDIAKEMTNFTKNNILSQAATAMLAQANAAPQGVLSLLQ